MMRFLKLFIIIFSLIIANILGVQSAFAETTSQTPEYKVYVIDDANLLTDKGRQVLADEMRELTPYGNMIFYTTRLPKKSDYEKHSQDKYYELCGNEPGVIFQIDMGNRKLTLSCSTQMEDILHSERDSIVDNIYLYATNKKYYRCASECFKQIKLVIQDGEIAHKMKHINNGILAVVLGLIINFIIICTTSRISTDTAKKNLLGKMAIGGGLLNVVVALGKTKKRYEPKRKGSSGGGGFSGGSRGGGGGFSGGSSSHGF